MQMGACSEIMDYTIEITNKLKNNKNFQNDNPFPYRDLTQTQPSNYIFEFIQSDMKRVIRFKLLEFSKFMDPNKQRIYPSMLEFSICTSSDDTEGGRGEENQKSLLDLIKHTDSVQRPIIAISRIRSRDFVHYFITIAVPSPSGRVLICTFDSLDRVKDAWQIESFSRGEYSDYETSGTVCVNVTIKNLKDKRIQHVNLAKYCYSSKCIQYYLGAESCAVYVVFFAAVCIWKDISLENHESVLMDAVKNTYDIHVNEAIIGDHHYDSSDKATKLMRTMYISFIMNIVFSVLTVDHIRDYLSDQASLSYVKEQYRVSLKANIFFARAYSVSLIMPQTFTRFCKDMTMFDLTTMLTSDEDNSRLLEDAYALAVMTYPKDMSLPIKGGRALKRGSKALSRLSVFPAQDTYLNLPL